MMLFITSGELALSTVIMTRYKVLPPVLTIAFLLKNLVRFVKIGYLDTFFRLTNCKLNFSKKNLTTVKKT